MEKKVLESAMGLAVGLMLSPTLGGNINASVVPSNNVFGHNLAIGAVKPRITSLITKFDTTKNSLTIKGKAEMLTRIALFDGSREVASFKVGLNGIFSHTIKTKEHSLIMRGYDKQGRAAVTRRVYANKYAWLQ